MKLFEKLTRRWNKTMIPLRAAAYLMQIGNLVLDAAIVTTRNNDSVFDNRSVYRLTVDNQNEDVPKDVTDVIVEEGIIVIDVDTFKWREQLKLIMIFPRSLQEIGSEALSYCHSLQSILIPRNVTTIGDWAFAHCVALREVIFENGSKLKSIGKYAFRYCTSVISLVIPQSVTTLVEGVFIGCNGLESMRFEEGTQLQIIPVNCFDSCYKLKTLIVPDAVTIIQEEAFRYCYNLTSVYFTTHSKLQYIQEEAFEKCYNLQCINLPSTIISINDEAFDQCNALSITLTTSDQDQQLHRFQHQYDNLPLHQLCFRNVHGLTQDKLVSIPNNDTSLIQQDACGLTPLHIVCSNPHADITMIKQIYNKHRAAAVMISAKNMTPWHMYLVKKGVIACKEFDAISNGGEVLEVNDIARAILREDAMLNNIHSLIGMGLEFDNDVYDVTLALHGVSFDQECNRSSETSGFYPYMTMAVSNKFTLGHVYDMAMKKMCMHNIQKH